MHYIPNGMNLIFQVSINVYMKVSPTNIGTRLASTSSRIGFGFCFPALERKHQNLM